MNQSERIKLEKDGLDVFEDILNYANAGFEAISEDDFTRMRWYGIYQQKPNVGHFMLRVKVPGGALSASQAKAIADISHLYGRDIVDVTTRQNFQFHWIEIQNFPDIFDRLNRVGLTTQGACGDIFRNVTGCPLAGIDPAEVLDCSPFIQQIQHYFLDNKEFSNLPRKYKTSIAGCPSHCSQPEINDIGATAVKRIRPSGLEEIGFQVRVGGGLSARPFLAKRLNMFISQEQLLDVFIAITTIFRDFGNRENRKKARLKFLVDEWGVERFEEELKSRLPFRPDQAEEWPEPTKSFRDHIGIHPQKQEGLNWIGSAVLGGRLNSAQLYKVVALMEENNLGLLRTTNQQNLLVTDIPTAKVDSIAKQLQTNQLINAASFVRRGSVACTGTEFCNLAITETKKLLTEIVEHIEGSVQLDEPVRINLNGCPNSCGQHHVGDIGLQGCLVKNPDGTSSEAYDISLGGRLGANARFVKPIWRRVKAEDLKFAIEALLTEFIGRRDSEEDFSDFVDRHSDEDLAGFMKNAFEVAL